MATLTSPTPAVQNYVTCMVNGMRFALPSRDVREIFRRDHADVVALPRTPSWVMGSLNHRGSISTVLDVRAVIGSATVRDELATMRTLLDAREKDHVDWLNALRDSVQTGAAFTGTTDPAHCAFGKWFDAIRNDEVALQKLSRGNPKLERLLLSLDTPHRIIHSVAHDALAHARAGRPEAAQAVIQKAWDTELKAMRELFGEILNELSQVLLILCAYRGEAIALVVDQVLAVGAIHFDQVEGEPDSRGLDHLVESYALDGKKNLVQVTSLDRLAGRLHERSVA